MINIKYLMGRLLRMDYRSMLGTIDKLHDKTGRSCLWLLADMACCAVRYGAGYQDYKLCAFHSLPPAQRATYVTRGINNRIVKLCNDPQWYHCLGDKREFNRIFSSFVRRSWLDLEECTYDAFARFMDGKDSVISKPASSTCGKGIEKLCRADFGSLEELYDHLKASGADLVEDVIVQHSDMAKLYPNAVNTYRIVTIARNGTAGVVYAYIRIGNGGRFVDNFNSGGMTAPVELDSGIIRFAAFDKDGRTYETHPATGCPIAGYRLPYWRESLELCLEAARLIPQLGYVGWDVAVSEDGPQLIEGNHFPGHDILQMPPHVPDKVGMLPRFREFLPEL